MLLCNKAAKPTNLATLQYMSKKKKKYKGLNPKCHYSHAREFVDFDYADKLSDEEAQWLSNFADNYYGGRFKKNDDENPIKGIMERRECYNRSRKRQQDFMSGTPLSRTHLTDRQKNYVEITEMGIGKRLTTEEEDDEDTD